MKRSEDMLITSVKHLLGTEAEVLVQKECLVANSQILLLLLLADCCHNVVRNNGDYL
jgi:hypothetical protein